MRHSKDMELEKHLRNSTDSKFEKYWRREASSVCRAGPGGEKNNWAGLGEVKMSSLV